MSVLNLRMKWRTPAPDAAPTSAARRESVRVILDAYTPPGARAGLDTRFRAVLGALTGRADADVCWDRYREDMRGQAPHWLARFDHPDGLDAVLAGMRSTLIEWPVVAVTARGRDGTVVDAEEPRWIAVTRARQALDGSLLPAALAGLPETATAAVAVSLSALIGEGRRTATVAHLRAVADTFLPGARTREAFPAPTIWVYGWAGAEERAEDVAEALMPMVAAAGGGRVLSAVRRDGSWGDGHEERAGDQG